MAATTREPALKVTWSNSSQLLRPAHPAALKSTTAFQIAITSVNSAPKPRVSVLNDVSFLLNSVLIVYRNNLRHYRMSCVIGRVLFFLKYLKSAY